MVPYEYPSTKLTCLNYLISINYVKDKVKNNFYWTQIINRLIFT